MIKYPCALLLASSAIAVVQTQETADDLVFSVDARQFSEARAWVTRSGPPITLSGDSNPASPNLVFRAEPGVEYVAENDLVVGDKPFAVHSITLAPSLTAPAEEASRVTITGRPLLLVPDTQRTAPYIALGARDAKPSHAVFDLATNLLASGEFHVTGDGNQSFAISGRIAQADGALSMVKSGTSTVTLSSSNHWTGTTRVVGGAIVLVEGDSIGSGPLEIGPGASVRFESITPRAGLSTSLTLAEKSRLDLNGNTWIIDYTGDSPHDSIRAMVNDERITSTSRHPKQVIALVEAAQLGRDEFAQRTLDDSALIITVALQGDANLDGTVNASDLERVSESFEKAGSWTDGDFTGDGKVDFDDLLRVAQNYDAAGQFDADWTRLRGQPR